MIEKYILKDLNLFLFLNKIYLDIKSSKYVTLKSAQNFTSHYLFIFTIQNTTFYCLIKHFRIYWYILIISTYDKRFKNSIKTF